MNEAPKEILVARRGNDCRFKKIHVTFNSITVEFDNVEDRKDFESAIVDAVEKFNKGIKKELSCTDYEPYKITNEVWRAR